jgi:putative ABC transport system permease protein
MTMWLIARRTFARQWPRLIATMFAAMLSVGLIGGVLQFAMQAQASVASSHASEYARADIIVQPAGAPSLADSGSQPPASFISAATQARAAAVRGVAGTAGDLIVPLQAVGTSGQLITAPAGGQTMLRPWIADNQLSAYHLVSGHAPHGPSEVVVDRHIATAGGLRAGDVMTLLLPRTTWRARVVGVVTVDGASSVASGDIVLASPATAQQAAGLPAGAWQDIWLKAAPGTSAARLRARLSTALGSSAQVTLAADTRSAELASIQDLGVQIGSVIGVLALLGVFVGLFVIANTFGALIGQRTRQLALLRAIGCTPRQARRLVRMEALCLGLIASAGGLVAGIPVASELARVFASDGFDITAAGVQLNWVYLTVPVLLGVAATQLAARRAAKNAARVSPMAALRATAAEGRTWSWRRMAGTVLILGATALFVALAATARHHDTTGAALLVMIGAMFGIGAVSRLAPYLVRPIGHLAGTLGVAVRGEAGWLARAAITRRPRRVSGAVSALMLGVAIATTAGVVVTSLQAHLRSYGTQTLTATDGVTTTRGRTLHGPVTLPADVTSLVRAVPGVALAVPLTAVPAVIVRPQTEDPAAVAAGEPPPVIDLTGANLAGLSQVVHLRGQLPRLSTGQIALSSGFARRYRMHPGSKITLSSANGDVTLTVAGTYTDPSGLFVQDGLVTQQTMALLTGDAPVTDVLVRAAPHISSAALATALARAVAGVPVARAYTRTGLVDHLASSDIREFNLLYVFLAMAVFVALFGLGTTVSLNVAERTREFGLLAAVGATSRQIRSIVRWEAGTVVVTGSLLGAGTALGTVWMIHVMTGSPFISPAPPLWLLGLIVAGSAIVAFLSSALPARRAASVPTLKATGAF